MCHIHNVVTSSNAASHDECRGGHCACDGCELRDSAGATDWSAPLRIRRELSERERANEPGRVAPRAGDNIRLEPCSCLQLLELDIATAKKERERRGWSGGGEMTMYPRTRALVRPHLVSIRTQGVGVGGVWGRGHGGGGMGEGVWGRGSVECFSLECSLRFPPYVWP